MPLFPVKDRTIRMTLETRGANGSSQNTAASQPRFVSQFIPNSGLLGGLVSGSGLRGVESTLDLIGPTSIDIAYSSDVAAEAGLFTSFIQPWFIKPVRITIAGTSYIGAYAGMARADRDAKGILDRFRRSQNDFVDLGGKPGNAARLLIEMTGLPRGMSRFLGYIEDFNIKEGVDKAYLLGYTIQFVGRNMDDAKVRQGKQNGQAAKTAQGVASGG